MTICIVGAGVAGLILVLLLQSQTIADITILDPHFDGGDLCRRWGAVISNTRWEQALQALEPYARIPAWARELSLEQPTTLATLGRLVRELAEPAVKRCVRIQGLATSAAFQNGIWTIQTAHGQTIQAKALCITTGAEPNSLHLPAPSIPLEVALNLSRLKAYIQPSDSVVIFGTSHSGILALQNALEAGPKSVVGIYRGEKPFRFARDGDYDGLKLEGAATADRLLTERPAKLELVRCDDASCSFRAVLNASWIVYATGFEPRRSIHVSVDGVQLAPNWMTQYNGQTGELTQLPSAWGFGIAFPSQAPDGVHWDVGVAPFVEHMSRQIPRILAAAAGKRTF